jgi:hypothetical protein
MKKSVYLLGFILLMLSFVLGISGISQAEVGISVEEVDAAISEAEGMLPVTNLNTIPSEPSEGLEESVTECIQEAEASLVVAKSSRNRGNLENALEEARDAIESLVKANKLLSEKK